MPKQTEIRQFWLDVQNAHDEAVARPNHVIKVTRNGHEATITYAAEADVVVITVQEVDTRTHEPLIVPGGDD